MTVLHTCPSCGLDSEETRCPRCNTLKVIGCSGACSVCGSSCRTDAVPDPPAGPAAQLPSDTASSDDEHPGTPLER